MDYSDDVMKCAILELLDVYENPLKEGSYITIKTGQFVKVELNDKIFMALEWEAFERILKKYLNNRKKYN